MVCAVWSTATFLGCDATGLVPAPGEPPAPAEASGDAEAAGAGVAASPILWTVSCFLQRESPRVRVKGMTTNLETIATSMAFKSGHSKNKRFLHNRRTQFTVSGEKFCLSRVIRLSVLHMPGCSRISFLLAVLALASWQTVSKEQRKNTSRTFNTVVVDAGHGGKDSGAYRRSGPPEKIATLDVATRLSQKLRESQFKVVMTRTDDTFIPLDTRVDIENATPKSVFVSIHFNDSRRRLPGCFYWVSWIAGAKPLPRASGRRPRVCATELAQQLEFLAAFFPPNRGQDNEGNKNSGRKNGQCFGIIRLIVGSTECLGEFRF